MTTTITWFGHATFGIQSNGKNILIDPFFSGNPKSSEKEENVAADFILVTHGHGDHIGDTLSIAKRTGALVIANAEICGWINSQGYSNTHAQHIGGGFHHPFGYVKLTIAHHGSGLPDGSYGGNPAGFLITFGDKKVYFAGDTGLFSTMELYGREGIELAFLPIGDNFTMGPDDAFTAVKLLTPNRVVPIHYGTWPPIEQNASSWADKVNAETNSSCILMNRGENIEL